MNQLSYFMVHVTKKAKRVFPLPRKEWFLKHGTLGTWFSSFLLSCLVVDDEVDVGLRLLVGQGRWLVLVDSTKEYMIWNLRSMKSVFM